MKQFFTLIALIVVAAIPGCSFFKTAKTEEPAANVVAESQFAHITDAKVALAEGKRLLDENQTALAIDALDQAVKIDPDLAEAHFQLGIAHSLLEMQKQLDGTAVEAAANTKDGKSRSRSEKAFEKAVEAYKKWIVDNPKDDSAQYNLGRSYAKLMKDEEAEKAFRQAVKINPEDSEYQTELGAILIKLADYREAIAPLKKAIELDPSNVRAQDLLEDAEAGRQRIDYVPPKKDGNQADGNQNTNSNSVSNTNTNSAPMRSNSNSRTTRDQGNQANPPPKPPSNKTN